MNELIFMVEEAPEGGYTARALRESIFTEADDLPTLHQQVRDAVRCHFEEAQTPKIIRLHFVRKGGRDSTAIRVAGWRRAQLCGHPFPSRA